MTCISSNTHLITPATKYKNVFWYSEKIRFIEPQGINGHRRAVPGPPSSGTYRESQVMFRDWTVWYCRTVLWVSDPRGQYSGKFRFIEKPGVQDEGGRHVAKRSSDPRVAYSEVNVLARDLVRGMGIAALFALRGFSIRGKFVLSIKQAKSRIPALSYFQLGGMKHDRELYAKVSYIPSA